MTPPRQHLQASAAAAPVSGAAAADSMVRTVAEATASATVLPSLPRPADNLPVDNLKATLPEMVSFSLRRYLSQINTSELAACGNLHALVMDSIEQVLVREVLASVEGNQVKAAAILGISRNTLRKRLT